MTQEWYAIGVRIDGGCSILEVVRIGCVAARAGGGVCAIRCRLGVVCGVWCVLWGVGFEGSYSLCRHVHVHVMSMSMSMSCQTICRPSVFSFFPNIEYRTIIVRLPALYQPAISQSTSHSWHEVLPNMPPVGQARLVHATATPMHVSVILHSTRTNWQTVGLRIGIFTAATVGDVTGSYYRARYQTALQPGRPAHCDFRIIIRT